VRDTSRVAKIGTGSVFDHGGPLPPGPNMDPAAKTSMQEVDDVLVQRSLDFMDCSVKAGKLFFLWHNSTRMHSFTHLSPKWENRSGYGFCADGTAQLDGIVGSLLKKLDELGIADNTIVVFTSDKGAETERELQAIQAGSKGAGN